METAIELRQAARKPVPAFYFQALKLSAATMQVHSALQLVDWMNQDSVVVSWSLHADA